jgi:hypothetical protein
MALSTASALISISCACYAEKTFHLLLLGSRLGLKVTGMGQLSPRTSAVLTVTDGVVDGLCADLNELRPAMQKTQFSWLEFNGFNLDQSGYERAP